MNLNKKQIIILVGVAALLGGLISSLITSQKVSANIFSDIWNWVNNSGQNKNVSSTSSTPGENVATSTYHSKYDYEQAIIAAVKKASPAVVSIVITKDLPVIEQCPQTFDPFFNLPPDIRQFFGDNNFGGFQFYAPCEKGTKKQEVGGGSGFIVSSDGLIVTNKHVVADKNADYTVLLNDGKKYPAKVVARDSIQDLAVLKINASNLPTLSLGNSDNLELGQTVIAIGNALGEFRNTVSVGVVSGLSRTITASGADFESETIQNVIQTDAAINPGNSGGPLLDLNGNVIGINTAIVAGAQNIGFAIPINHVKRDINSVKTTGSIQLPYLGVRYLMITPEIAQSQKLKVDYGALLRGNSDGPAVEKNSPAAQAGLMAEDIILEVNGQKVDSDHSLISIVQEYNVGDTINLKVLRGEKTINISVTLGKRPDNL